MKAILLALGMSFCGSLLALADNVSKVEQIGDTHIAVAKQVDGGAAGNTSVFRQEGTGHEATVRQTGITFGFNYSEIFQIGQANRAELVQDAHGFTVDIQTTTASLIRQNGIGNEAVVEQFNGFRMISDIQQVGVDNRAGVEQGAGNGKANLTIQQTGSGNEVEVHQLYDAAYAFTPGYNAAGVNQTGEGNGAKLIQDGRSDSMTSALIRQDGSGNRVDALQADPAGGSVNGLKISQHGADNYAQVKQVTSLSNSSHNESRISQTGLNNAAVNDQIDVALTTSDINQLGNDNISSVEQNQGVWRSNIAVDGASNQVDVLQTSVEGESSNDSRIQIDGVANIATVMQTGVGGSNSSEIAEAGDNNMIWVDQDASYHGDHSESAAMVLLRPGRPLGRAVSTSA